VKFCNARETKRSRVAATAPRNSLSRGATEAPELVFSEQDDQKDDQQNETADTDIHGFAPTVLGLAM
jgi:hypothetical protein